eukprot:gnl/TRDRNA2_/TRDRNA2_46331_c0_seq1.p1 gnl/TRDRNA2_/TRDRNA2_46331_c0~~gnl/TRDRNA2_/TRDRNA2_46331_c0_seq1.p1  ORF type:complete len:487 (-),score=115.25 gnl/TRDRNA2_/TRDRNA2_46331_c0_seq1:248-1594(-)
MVAHQWDLRHGVRIENGTRLSWIMWFGDTPDCSKDSERWYGKRWAEKRDPTAAFLLGQAYQGESAAEGGGRSYELFKTGAEEGLPYAMFNVAVTLSTGMAGVAQDHVAAMEWWRKAAEKGFGQAQTALGVKLATGGPGVPADLKEAETWYRRAAESPVENAQAQLLLGELLSRGSPSLAAESLGWIQRAAEQGVPEARQAMVSRAAREGNPDGLPPPSFLVAAAQAGDSTAMLVLGLHYTGSGPGAVHAKVKWYEKAAAVGNAAAAENLGKLHYAGEGDIEPDPDKALEWFEQAADLGAKDSMHSAGMILLEKVEGMATGDAQVNADGGSEASEASVELGKRSHARLEAAANKGHVGAMRTLAEVLVEGLPGFEAGPQAAGMWARRAAEAGDKEAMWLWAQMLGDEEGEYGPGTPDKEAAHTWTVKAAEAGQADAIAALDSTGKQSEL